MVVVSGLRKAGIEIVIGVFQFCLVCATISTTPIWSKGSLRWDAARRRSPGFCQSTGGALNVAYARHRVATSG